MLGNCSVFWFNTFYWAFHFLFGAFSPAIQFIFVSIRFAAGIYPSALAFFLGHFSYPRVHNLKVYLLGYLTGFSGLGYFLFRPLPMPGPLPHTPMGFMVALYLLIFINILSRVALVPSFVKYRTARHIVLSIIPWAECTALILFRFSPHATAWASFFSFHGYVDPALYAGVMFFLLATGATLWRIKDEFYLGGIIAGSALLYGFS